MIDYKSVVKTHARLHFNLGVPFSHKIHNETIFLLIKDDKIECWTRSEPLADELVAHFGFRLLKIVDGKGLVRVHAVELDKSTGTIDVNETRNWTDKPILIVDSPTRRVVLSGSYRDAIKVILGSGSSTHL